MPPVYLFVIGVSAAAYACGMVSVVASTIKSCLDQLPGDERTMVGFITYDATLHFYNLKANLAAPQVGVGRQRLMCAWHQRAARKPLAHWLTSQQLSAGPECVSDRSGVCQQTSGGGAA